MIFGLIISSIIAFTTLSCNNNNLPKNNVNIQVNEINDINILLLSGDDNSQIEKALRINDNFNVEKNIPFNSSFLLSNNFNTVVISNYQLDDYDVENLTNYFTAGGSIFFIFGPKTDFNRTKILLSNVGINATLKNSSLEKDATIGINYTTGEQNHPLVKNIQWSSMPAIRNYTIVTTSSENLKILLSSNVQPQAPILASIPNSNNNSFIFLTPWVVPGGNNYQIEVWPYFNYMIFLITEFLHSQEDQKLPSFAEWPHSAVPHEIDTIIIAIIVTSLGSIAVLLFFIQMRKSKKSQIILTKKALNAITKEKEETMEHEDLSDKWEQIGTHRQISGFLFGLFAGILLGIPQIILTGIVFPKWIMPFPQVAGWFDWVKQFFQAIWMLFDVGTSIALAKFFSQYRIKKPRKAIHYIQIFIWWQMLSGVVQLIAVSLIGSIIFPRTNLAHLSWIVVLHSLIQYPGFFVVFIYIFQGMQRTDLQNLANLLYQAVLTLGSQYLFIYLFRIIFANSPQGEAFWAGIGYAVGQYFAQWGIFFIMMKFYKNLGFSVATIFRVDFTKEEFKEALIFGGKEAMGHVWVPLAYMYQVWLISAFLPNWNEEMGLFGFANTLMQVTALVGFLTEGFLSPISEAHSHQKQKLLDFTIAQGIKWSTLIIFFLIALLGAIGDKFIKILGSQWAPAARFIPLFLIYSMLQPYAWLGDKAMAASGFTGSAAIIWIIEQGGKMALLTLFIAINVLKIEIILYAHIPVLIIKCSISWWFIRKRIGHPKPYYWSSWIAPAISASIIYLIMWTLSLVFTGWLILIEFILAIFGLFFLYYFLAGFFGCFDDNTINEFKQAAEMVGPPVRALAIGLYKATEFGCKASPGLHGKYSMDIFNQAMLEAKELEKEKIKLKI
ncbi:MAG: lipopolysaccharide biosynthesis protein [Promethearchaeota archaeon]